MFRNIVVAIDGTLTARRGLEAAIAVARDSGAALHVVHVLDELVVVPMVDGSAMFAATQTDLMLKSLRELLAIRRGLARKRVQVRFFRGLVGHVLEPFVSPAFCRVYGKSGVY